MLVFTTFRRGTPGVKDPSRPGVRCHESLSGDVRAGPVPSDRLFERQSASARAAQRCFTEFRAQPSFEFGQRQVRLLACYPLNVIGNQVPLRLPVPSASEPSCPARDVPALDPPDPRFAHTKTASPPPEFPPSITRRQHFPTTLLRVKPSRNSCLRNRSHYITPPASM